MKGDKDNLFFTVNKFLSHIFYFFENFISYLRTVSFKIL